MGIFRNTAGFILSYIVFMLPTYALPYLGSNSLIGQSIGAAGSSATGDSNPLSALFLLHLLCLIVLIAITVIRGSVNSRKWIAVFPSIALIFDMVPGLNFIPLIPTIMHICAMVSGAKGTTQVQVVNTQTNTDVSRVS